MTMTRSGATQFTAPIAIGPDGEVERLDRLSVRDSAGSYDEAWVRDLLFKHPQCLPIAEIDRVFAPLVPIYKELHTPAGYIDALYVTPMGRIVVLEAKLWRNPEARRKVIGQILDYAKELKRWSYSDLQREVSKAVKEKGNALYRMVSARSENALDEAAFIDEVSRNLRRGRFLLLVAGDGIREEASAIAEFLMGTGTMHFTLALVEVAIYRGDRSGMFVQPRVLAKTAIADRIVAEALVPDTVSPEAEPELEDATPSESQVFWQEFLEGLKLDDPEQTIPQAPRKRNVWFRFPWSPNIWLLVYVSKPAGKKGGVGVSLRLRGPDGNDTYDRLIEDKVEIERELGFPVSWRSDGDQCHVVMTQEVADPFAPEERTPAIELLQRTVNDYINVFRPRLADLLE